MCGISGKIYFDESRPVDRETIEAMNAPIAHRGPDDEGIYVRQNVGLGHRRLSIIDLSSGRQPLSNEDDTIWVVFNGEIYNYQPLRKELLDKGHTFKTKTDTEVLVHLYEEFGPSFVSKLNGMFGFALYDESQRLLLLARDRTGIKPLYFCQTPDGLLFASEIKAILQDPSFSPCLNAQAIDRFLTFYYLPGDATLFKNVNKLLPGHYLTVQGGEVAVEKYWDLDFTGPKQHRNLEDAIADLNELLQDVVRDHLISDVPVGFFLSGGVDSTAMLSIAVEQSSKPISTFTIGFDDSSVADERYYASLAAKRFGTEHHEITIPPERFKDFLPRYVWHMEEPVCEPPAIALYFVSELAREHVKVVISGEGGDEAFAGYPNYRNLHWLEVIKRLLGPARGLVSKSILGLNSLDLLVKFRRYAESLVLPLEEHYYSRTSSPFHPFNEIPEQLYTEDFYHQLDKNWSLEPVRALFSQVKNRPALEKMLYVDTKTWLPDDLLVKADKITMAKSLELRVPLLDHRVLEFAANLPPNFKLRGCSLKHILKRTFRSRIPAEIIKRKKAGFPVPYDAWFRSELKGYLRDLLLDQRSLDRGYFRRQAVEDLIENNPTQLTYSKELFCLTVLELWHRMFLDRDRPTAAMVD